MWLKSRSVGGRVAVLDGKCERFTSSDLVPGRLQQGSILVMDDEEMVLNLVSMMLKCLGYQVTACRNGEEALAYYHKARAAETPYLAVILDLTVYGGMGGKDAARQILLEDPSARLIVSSGYAYDPIMLDPAAYGFQSTLAKPYLLSDLRAVLAGLFPLRGQTSAISTLPMAPDSERSTGA
jgi:CheY-like chemotaxis protein